MPIWQLDRLDLDAAHLPWPERWPAGLVAEVLAEAGPLFQPQAVYETVSVRAITSDGPALDDGTVLHSQLLGKTLGRAGHLLLTVYTIGPALEARARLYGEQGQFTRSFLLDAVGTVALEALAERLHRHIAAEYAPEGLRLGCSFSPGQDDWPLEEQRVLFALLHPEQIGVRLNEQNVMVPLKSVSEAIPLGRQGELGAIGPACTRCPHREKCPYRPQGDRDEGRVRQSCLWGNTTIRSAVRVRPSGASRPKTFTGTPGRSASRPTSTSP